MGPFNSARGVAILLDPQGLILTVNCGASRISYKLKFINNELVQLAVPHESSGPALQAFGIIGKVDFGPGYLLIIQDREVAAEIHHKHIYRIKRCLLIPLQHDLAQIVFDKALARQTAKNEAEVSDDDEAAGDDNDIDTVSDNDPEAPSIADDHEVPVSGGSIVETVLLKGPPRRTWTKWFSKTPDKKAPSKGQVQSTLVQKFVRSVSRSFKSGSYYFSYDLDLTNSLQKPPTTYPFASLTRSFYFNQHVMEPFEGTSLVLPIIQGFVSSIPFVATDKASEVEPEDSTIASDSAEQPVPEPAASPEGEDKDETLDSPQVATSEKVINGRIYLVSRRSTKRAGMRYLRRGIDDKGYCANWVETELIVQLDETICSYTQVRGSLPLYFSQSPYKLQPTPRVLKTKEDTTAVFRKHFDSLKKTYGDVAGISLVEKAPSRECSVGELYEQLAANNDVYMEWFDFHRVCKKLQFNKVGTLFDTPVGAKLDEFGWAEADSRQGGVFRTNCIDCLDRTNVIQATIARRVLGKIADAHGVTIAESAAFDTLLNSLWADNGDAISRQYSSTNALKGDFTRTNQRNYKGVLTDAFLTMSRYFYGMVSDFFMQAVVDYVVGNVGEEVFEEFEENMESADPSVNLEYMKSSAIESAAGIVLESENEVYYGGWWLLTPTRGDVRRAELRETILIVTDSAVYVCDFDLHAEKVVDFHRIPSASIKEIQAGAFFGEILSQLSRNPSRNRGLVLRYSLDGVTSAADNNLPSAKTTTNSEEPLSSVAFRVPVPRSDDYMGIVTALKHSCPEAEVVDKDIVTLDQATSDTGVWDLMEYYLKRAVWG